MLYFADPAPIALTLGWLRPRVAVSTALVEVPTPDMLEAVLRHGGRLLRRVRPLRLGAGLERVERRAGHGGYRVQEVGGTDVDGRYRVRIRHGVRVAGPSGSRRVAPRRVRPAWAPPRPRLIP
ncbi:hypothetical protein [Embleya hyalina]|uniref:hypothetical protein n=1 Tax=Embleya hyalina TaxID=516124 RepID=UPI000F84D241|nr:hypothetical protein [Embleya hyalina]